VSAAPLAAQCAALLGHPAGAVAVAGPGAAGLAPALGRHVALAASDATAGAAVVSFLGDAARPDARQAVLARWRDALPAGAPVVLVDHNQPRTWPRRLLGAGALLVRGLAPARARYPAARELAALGFAVERLRLAAGERVQLVLARRPG